MTSKFINNHGKYNQNKYYKKNFQKTILDKFSIVYISLIIIIDNE